MKILPVGAELFHADRRTDGQSGRHGAAKSHFLQFCDTRLLITEQPNTLLFLSFDFTHVCSPVGGKFHPLPLSATLTLPVSLHIQTNGAMRTDGQLNYFIFRVLCNYKSLRTRLIYNYKRNKFCKIKVQLM